MEAGVAAAKFGKPSSLRASFQHLRTASIRLIASGNGFTNIVHSHIRSRGLSTMLHSSPVAILCLLLVCCSLTLSNLGVVGPEWLRVMTGVSTEPKVVAGESGSQV